uniref:WWE domain-containing protein n=1 Tax=Plectus sambesii TaxID=2011161 RepID=A0A914VUE2_9BILA
MVKEELSDLQWEWEAKKDSWVRYDKASNEELNNNFEVSVVALKIEESDLEVDRMNMRQKNRTTGFERSVRCCIEEADGSRYAWEWQDEKRRWRSYPPNVVRQLESAHTSNESVVNVVIAERAYTIDLSSMEQKNDTSNVEKKVRRVASVAESAMVATPAPSAVRTRSMAKRKVEDDTEATTSKAPAKSQKAAAAKRSAKRTKLEDDDDEDQENEPRNT